MVQEAARLEGLAATSIKEAKVTMFSRTGLLFYLMRQLRHWEV